uniref:Myb/SANT-like DNA-binding domain-containing protein n=1 Tax=Anopheles maculatus TaxID=74869 RepID=A0A182SLJ0_9DIPT
MLQIMLDNSYASAFSSKHKQNMEIFRKIENKMIESGYHYKNYMQIGVRWKNLKNLYMKAKRSNSKNEQQLFPFYDEMDSLMSGLLKQASGEDYVVEPDEIDTVVKAESSAEKLSIVNDNTPDRAEAEP